MSALESRGSESLSPLIPPPLASAKRSGEAGSRGRGRGEGAFERENYQDELLDETIEASAGDAMKVREWNSKLAEVDEASAEIPPNPPLSKGGEGGFEVPEHLSYGGFLDGYSSGVVSSPYSRFALSPTLAPVFIPLAAVFARL